jgi:multiple sugar transport system substrate-binding protein
MKRFSLIVLVFLLMVPFLFAGGEKEEQMGEEKVVLNAMFLGATWGVAAKEMAKEYEAQTGVKVEIELVGRDDIHAKLALAIAGEADYDIFNIDYPWVPEFASTGNLLPLDDLAQKYNVDLSAYLPLALATTQWNGKNGDFGGGGTVYGLPQTIHPHLLWYRRDLFEDAVFKSSFKAQYNRDLSVPATWDEFGEVAEFFHGKTDSEGRKLSGWAAQATKGYGNIHTWLTFVYCYGGDVFDWDTMTPTLTTPAVVEATKEWADLLKFSPPGINDYTFAEVSSDAAQGRLAMAIHWSWSAFEVDDPEKSLTVGKWDFAPVPKAKYSVSHLAAWPIVIPKTTDNPEEAFKFIAWLENAENDVRQAHMGGGDPVRTASYQDARLVDQMIAGTDIHKFRRYEALAEAMKTTKVRPFFPQEEKWEITVSPFLSAVQIGDMTVVEALEAADKAVVKMLNE